jgi:type IV secretion system protein VirB5
MPTAPAAPDAAFSAGKRLYAEQWGDAVVTNTYLKLVILALVVICIGLMCLSNKVIKHIDGFKPLVIRIDDVGRAEAVQYDNMTYRPQAAEIKYFLSKFCQLYYGRNRYTIKSDLKNSLLFMDSQLADNTMQGWTKGKTIDAYLGNPQELEAEVKVSRVDIEDLRSAPFKATVVYEVSYISPVDRSEVKRSQYTAHFVFSFRDTVPNDLIQTNPLGLAISYFREDEALTN